MCRFRSILQPVESSATGAFDKELPTAFFRPKGVNMTIYRTIAARLFAAVALILALAVVATPAQAQATRTWVSGVGDDVNPCSRTAPCKTFAGAISKTAAGGEINCLDPGGF